MRQMRKYTPEFKAQMVKEDTDIGNLESVAKTHKIPRTTLYAWINKTDDIRSKNKKLNSVIQLRKKLSDI